MYSRSKKVTIDKELVSALEEIEGITVKINGKIAEKKQQSQDENEEEMTAEEFISD